MELSNGAKGTRIPDPLNAIEVRYQLRYSPVRNYEYSMTFEL